MTSMGCGLWGCLRTEYTAGNPREHSLFSFHDVQHFIGYSVWSSLVCTLIFT